MIIKTCKRYKAYGRNQSIVQPAMIPGNLRALSGNLAETGDIQRTTWRLLIARVKKNLIRLSVVSTKFGICFAAMYRSSDDIWISSSFGKRFGISPVVSMELITSTNESQSKNYACPARL